MKKIILTIGQICTALIALIITYAIADLLTDDKFKIVLWSGVISTTIIYITNPFFKTE